MTKVTVKGKGNISATVIADSISLSGDRLITFELEYPRFIHSEVMTHRMLSKNAASSRAIPVLAMIENIKENTATPVYWGKNQSGMVAKEELGEVQKQASLGIWFAARDSAISHATILHAEGNHKQVVNRALEPYMMMKTVMTGTEWANLIWLRDHPDAQPEFKELAGCIVGCIRESRPKLLVPGVWHLPYVNTSVDADGKQVFFDTSGEEISLQEAKMISASCCAQVSYRKNDDTLEKACKVYDMLNLDQDDVPKHASPVEHQATPMEKPTVTSLFGWEQGVTHVDRAGYAWSGNLKGWIQYRKLIPGEARW